MKPDNAYFDRILEDFGYTSILLEYEEELSEAPVAYFPDDEIVFSSDKSYHDFTITINGFKSSGREKYLSDQSPYKRYLQQQTRPFYKEVLDNTALLNSKPKIIQYLNELLTVLTDIFEKFQQTEIELQDGFSISVISYPDLTINSDKDVHKDGFLFWVIAQFLYPQREVLSNLRSFVQEQYDLVGKLSYKEIRELYPQKYMHEGLLKWEKDQTDLLELIVALMETGSISDPVKPTTRKEVVKFFGKLFGEEFSNSESLLSRATLRKKDVSPYLKSLVDAFDQYCTKKAEKKASRQSSSE